MKSKSIVLFSDGTGNSAGSPHKSNVWRLYKSLDIHSSNEQVTFYDDGVGTSSFSLFRLFGQAFGLGLAGNVKRIYSFACRAYTKNDKIYGFGFSRGAFTMRVVMSLIADQGLVKPEGLAENEFTDKVDRAYMAFRKKGFKLSVLSFVPKLYHLFFRHEELSKAEVIHPAIEMIGVWDTVDAYGMPIDEMRRAWDFVIYPLAARDMDCPKAVKHAYHALALDEQRLSFAPALWNEPAEPNTGTERNKVTQVWFPGVHSDIGGSYPDGSLSFLSLNWMIKNAQRHELIFDPNSLLAHQKAADANGPMHDSRSGIGFIYRFEPRNLELLCRNKTQSVLQYLSALITKLFSKNKNVENHVFIENPKLHKSIFDRMSTSSNNYAPINIPESYYIVDEDSQIVEQVSGSRQTARRDAQGGLWNIVAARKLIYFINVLLLVLFLISLIRTYGTTLVDPNWSHMVVDFIKGSKPAAFILGTILGLLYLGGKFKTLLHTRMRYIWSVCTDEEKLRSQQSPIISSPIYDERIKSGTLYPSPTRKIVIVVRNVIEIISVLAFAVAPIIVVNYILNINSWQTIVLLLVFPILIIGGLLKLFKL